MANQGEILARVMDRLASRVPGQSESTVLLCSDAYPNTQPPSDVFLTVTPHGGNFDLYNGGGHAQVTKFCSFSVTIYTRSLLDRADSEAAALIGTEMGVMSVTEKQVLRALLVDDDDDIGVYDPKALDANGNEFRLLRDCLAPASYSAPGAAENAGGITYTRYSLDFTYSFDWDLGQPTKA